MYEKSTTDLLNAIAALQNAQKRSPPSSSAWLAASAALAPLFAEMARRQKTGAL